MIRLSKLRCVFIGIIAVLVFFKADAQNLFNENNSSAYANYLFQAQEFELAALEYERLVFLNADKTEYQQKLLQSYRLNHQYVQGIKRLNELFPDQKGLSTGLSAEYAKMLILNKDFANAMRFIENADSLESDYVYLISLDLLQANWDKALLTSNSYADLQSIMVEDLKKIAIEGQKIPYKSPVLAGVFSTIIPGTGKVYSNQWKDGLVALIFVAGNAWQSYRGFKKDGIASPYGWVFGTVAFGFYTGNIYGSYKAAKRHNLKLDNDLINKTESFLIDQF